jgi:uncharacterized membrane protein
MSRPRRALVRTTTDKASEYISAGTLSFIWAYTLWHFSSLPDTIPIHFNAAGEPDNIGGKRTILTLPVVATVIYVGLTVLNRYPHIFNYPVRITEANALKHYTAATRLLRYLKLAIMVIVGCLVYNSIQTALGTTDGLGPWFLPVVLALTFGPLVVYLFQTFAKKG